MNDENKNDNKFETIEILQNVIVIYINGDREHYDAIYKTEKGVYTGYILNDKSFVEGGFIPKYSIKHIEDGVKRIVYKKQL